MHGTFQNILFSYSKIFHIFQLYSHGNIFLGLSDLLLPISVLAVMGLRGKGDCQTIDIPTASKLVIYIYNFSENNLSEERNILKH